MQTQSKGESGHQIKRTTSHKLLPTNGAPNNKKPVTMKWWGRYQIALSMLATISIITIYIFYSQQRDLRDQLYEANTLTHELQKRATTYEDRWIQLQRSLKSNQTFILPNHDKSVGMKGKLQYTIIILTYNRVNSLKRLLHSLVKANYTGHTVHLDIHVDFPSQKTKSMNNEHRTCREIAANINWPHGQKRVFLKTMNNGLVNTWFQAWYPVTDYDIGIVLEDDVEVSPFYFQFVATVLEKYYLDETSRDPRMAFLCLYPLYQKGFHEFSKGGSENTKDLYCSTKTGFFKQFGVATWGAVIMPGPWRGFVNWIFKNFASSDFNSKTTLRHMANGWSNAWTPYFFKYEFEHGLYSLRYCFADREGMLINHKEPGEHFGSKQAVSDKLTKEYKEEHMRIHVPLKDVPCWNFHVEPQLKKVADSFCPWTKEQKTIS